MKKVIYTCPYMPAEWIAAHGFKPCRIVPFSNGTNSEIIRTEGLCPYVRDFINNFSNEKGCVAVFTTLCDQMRRGYDIITCRLKIPAFLMNVPSTWQTVTSQKLYLDELKRLSNFLVQMGGKTPSNEKLVEVMLKYEKARKSIIDLNDKLPALQFAQLLEQFGKEGPDNFPFNKNENISNQRGIPLAIVGSPILKQNIDILQITEQLGGRIVFNATENGERGLCGTFNQQKLKENPLMELADAYFNGIQDASRRPNSELYKWMRKNITERNIKGIIFHRNIWCDIWHAELERLKDWINLPVLDIESTGESESANQNTINRIRAFLEILS